MPKVMFVQRMLDLFKHEPLPTQWRTQAPAIARPLLAAAARHRSLVDALQDTVVDLGFDHFMVTIATSVHPAQQARSYRWTSLPTEWLHLYDGRDFVEIDPCLRAAWDSLLPVVWDELTFPGGSSASECLDAAARFGIRSGVALALRGRREAPGVFMLTSSLPDLCGDRAWRVADTLSQVMALGLYVHECFVAAAHADCRSGTLGTRPLSARERVCLQLAARGRTSREIGAELSIGEHAVHAHFANLFAKLGAANRHEAIAKATQAGLIAA